jgi:PAS domain S-box-containing protein
MPKPIQKSAIIETIDEMILATDDRGFILYVNPATLRRSHFEESEVLGQSVEHLFEFSDSQKQQIFQKSASGSIADMTASAICKDGSSFAVQISMSRLPTVVGQPGLIFVAMDITRIRKRLDEQARLITAVEQAAESIIVTDSNGLVQYVNPAFEEITGYLSSEIIGHRTDLIDSESHKRSFYQSIRDTLLRGDIWQGRLVIKAKDGAMCETETTISPVKNASGEITNHVHVQRDVTHEVRLEQQLRQQLRQAQKMEAIGTLAGGIAHDFNNLLMGIQGNVSLSLLEVDASTGFYQNLKKIEQLVQNGVDLTKQLLGFARGGKYEISVVDMNQLLKEQNLMFGRTNKEVIFDGHYAPTLWRVEPDRTGPHEPLPERAAGHARRRDPVGSNRKCNHRSGSIPPVSCQSRSIYKNKDYGFRGGHG